MIDCLLLDHSGNIIPRDFEDIYFNGPSEPRDMGEAGQSCTLGRRGQRARAVRHNGTEAVLQALRGVRV